MSTADLITWPADGLIPVVAQDADSGTVLMVAFMDRVALDATVDTGFVHYHSRSRGRLWKKGETSGHVQRVASIHVNCNGDSLLLRVHQVGAVCHDGYATCYYRDLLDGAWQVVTEREFDPAAIYGLRSSRIAQLSQQQFGAYRWMRDHDLTADSGTSRRLRSTQDDVTPRLIDELGELAAAVTGEHLHGTLEETLRIEGGQVLYWLLLRAIREGWTWADLRPDLVLEAAPVLDADETARAARECADSWRTASTDPFLLARETLAVVGSALSQTDIPAEEVIAQDLAELAGKAYLVPYFAMESEAM